MSNDPAALFATSADTNRNLLLTVATNVVGYQDAEDVVQQSLLKAWDSLHQWHGGGLDGMRYWLCRVTKTVGLDWREYARLRTYEPLAAAPEPVDDETPEAACLRRERQEEARRQVTEGLARCTVPQRRALWSIAQEMTREEAARAFGVANGRMKTDRFRAMRAFQALNVMTGRPLRQLDKQDDVHVG